MTKRHAFTLWECLIVMTILAIGVAILVPLRNFKHESIRRSSCQYNLKQIGLAFMQYAQDYDEKFPPIANASAGYWAGSLQPYIKGWTFFQCVSDSTVSNDYRATDYFFNARLAQLSRAAVFEDSKAVTFTILSGDGTGDNLPFYHLSQLPDTWRTDDHFPAWRHLDGANYGFADGHVKWLKPEKITLDKPSVGKPTFLVK